MVQTTYHNIDGRKVLVNEHYHHKIDGNNVCYHSEYVNMRDCPNSRLIDCHFNEIFYYNDVGCFKVACEPLRKVE